MQCKYGSRVLDARCVYCGGTQFEYRRAVTTAVPISEMRIEDGDVLGEPVERTIWDEVSEIETINCRNCGHKIIIASDLDATE